MATSNQIERSVNRAQKLREQQAALDAKLREGATDSRSRWAEYADLNMKEFYFLVVEGAEPSHNDSETASGGDSTAPSEPENHGSDFGEATADFVSGNQGF